MRALVSCGRIGRLNSAGASSTATGALMGRGAQAAVALVSGGGEGLAEVSVRFSPGARVLAAENFRQACDMLVEGPDYLDVTTVAALELGELLGLPVILTRAGTTVVVPHREAGRALTGPTESLAKRGWETGTGIAAALTGNSRAAAWLERLGVTGRAPAGVLCGLGAWVPGCGARVASGARICADGYRLSELAAKTNVIVTGTDALDLYHCSGDVVAELTRPGVEALKPMIVVAGRNFVPSRELRLVGIEEMHAVTPSGEGEIDITAKQSKTLTQRVAGTWTWRNREERQTQICE